MVVLDEYTRPHDARAKALVLQAVEQSGLLPQNIPDREYRINRLTYFWPPAQASVPRAALIKELQKLGFQLVEVEE